MFPMLHGLVSQGGIVYLLRDEFESGDTTSPRSATPGPGSFIIDDTGTRTSINGERLQIAAGSSVVSLMTAQYARANGLALFVTAAPVTGSGGLRIGFTNGSGANTYQTFLIANGASNSGIYAWYLISALFDARIIQRYFVILRSVGAFFGGYIDGIPTLLYVDTSQTHASPQASINANGTTSAASPIDNAVVTAMTGPQWASDWALATSRTASPPTGQTGTMNADGIVEFTWTPASSEVAELMIRRTDDDNCWIVRCDQAGSRIYLYQKQTGTETERGATGGVAQTWTAGTAYRVVAICAAQQIQVITSVAATGMNAERKLVYTAASFNQAETGIKVTGFATGANLVAWPRTGLTIPAALGGGKALKILGAGDSRTAAGAWQETLVASLNANSDRVWLPPLNYGVSAHKVADCKIKLQSLTTVSEGIDYALLNIGINDAIGLPFPDEATFKADYLACLDAINSRYPAAWVGCMRVGARNYASQCITVNSWIDYCITQRSFAHMGPDESIWAEGGDNYNTMTTDGLHYSAAGQAQCAAQWQAVMGY